VRTSPRCTARRSPRETIFKITDAVLTEMAEWLNRPLEYVYAAVFIDAVVVEIRDGKVTNRPWIRLRFRGCIASLHSEKPAGSSGDGLLDVAQ
jgi:Transposase, Mutator family